MDAGLKAKWVEALRSGAYRQCRTALADFDAYCCLGVLCEVAGQHINRKKSFGRYYDFVDATIGRPTSAKLIGMNDGNTDAQHSFDQIADWIEANIPSDPPLSPSITGDDQQQQQRK